MLWWWLKLIFLYIPKLDGWIHADLCKSPLMICNSGSSQFRLQIFLWARPLLHNAQRFRYQEYLALSSIYHQIHFSERDFVIRLCLPSDPSGVYRISPRLSKITWRRAEMSDCAFSDAWRYFLAYEQEWGFALFLSKYDFNSGFWDRMTHEFSPVQFFHFTKTSFHRFLPSFQDILDFPEFVNERKII